MRLYIFTSPEKKRVIEEWIPQSIREKWDIKYVLPSSLNSNGDKSIINYNELANIAKEGRIKGYAISLYFPNMIKHPLINAFLTPIINIHPAPLPEYKGVGWETLIAITNRKTWEVTAHTIDMEAFDVGKVININSFSIYSLEPEARIRVLDLKTKQTFKKVVELIETGQIYNHVRKPIKIINEKEGRYYSKKDIEKIILNINQK